MQVGDIITTKIVHTFKAHVNHMRHRDTSTYSLLYELASYYVIGTAY